MLSIEQKIEILTKREFKNNDLVSFRVENQNTWVGPNIGILKIPNDAHPYIDLDGTRLEIGEYLGAYPGTIFKVTNFNL